ncbi:MAG: hypothetical protein HY940_03935 [Gammaproteobacteria bacterium]|nr:hypothetical protein [Gammaproteobacteria bacterium]
MSRFKVIMTFSGALLMLAVARPALAVWSTALSTTTQPDRSWGVYWTGSDITTLAHLNASAVDASGNVYAIGYADSTSNTVAGSSDILVVKTSPAGALLWTRIIDVAGAVKLDEGVALAADNLGNLYIAANVTSAAGGLDFYVAKLNATTNATIWSQQYDNSTGRDILVGMALASDGNSVYLAGTSVLSGSTEQRVTVVKYSSTGGAPVWAKTEAAASSGDRLVVGLALDANNNAYVAGTRLCPPATSSTVVCIDEDVFVTKYSAVDGSYLWAGGSAVYDSGSEDRASVLGLDPQSGDLYVAGFTTRGTASAGGGNSTILIRKRASDGTNVWNDSLPVDFAGKDIPASMAFDGNGGVYVAVTTNIGDASNVGVVKFNSNDGLYLWKDERDFGGNSRDLARSVVVDAAAQKVVVFGLTGTPSAGSSQMYMSWNLDGSRHAAHSYPLGGDERQGRFISTSLTGGIYAGGISAAAGSAAVPVYLAGSTDQGSSVKYTVSRVGLITSDLVMTAVSAPALGVYGLSTTFTATIKNNRDASIGNLADVTSPFQVGIYLRDRAHVLPDTLISQFSVAALASGASTTATSSYLIPNTIPQAVYDLVAIADTGSAITEYSEVNNELVGGTIQIIDPSDLTISSIGLGGVTSILAGRDLTVSYTVSNIRAINASNVNVGFSLSANTVAGDGDDIALTVKSGGTFASVLGNTSVTGSAVVTVPNNIVAPQNYYVVAKVDPANTVIEANESNNSAVSGAALAVNSIVDLTLGDIHITDLDISGVLAHGVQVGTTANVSVKLVASSTGPTLADTAVDIYLSTDNAITTADTKVGSRVVPAMSAGTTDTGSATVSIPGALTPGVYYLGGIADPANTVIENNENNNLYVDPIEITVSTPTSAADLIVSSVSTTATSITRGTNLDVAVTTQNTTAGAAGAFNVGIYLSSDATITAADYRLGTLAMSGLAGNTSQITSSVLLPVPTDRVENIVWTKVTQASVDASNTLKALAGFGSAGASSLQTIPAEGRVEYVVDILRNRQFGLSVTDVDTGWTTIDYSLNLALSGTFGAYEKGVYKSCQWTSPTNSACLKYVAGDRFAVQRKGTVVTFLRNGVVFYTSTTPANSAMVGDFSMTDTNTTYAGVQVINAVLPTGSYYLGAIADADAAVAELSETNNSRVSMAAGGGPKTYAVAVVKTEGAGGGGSLDSVWLLIAVLSLSLTQFRRQQAQAGFS